MKNLNMTFAIIALGLLVTSTDFVENKPNNPAMNIPEDLFYLPNTSNTINPMKNTYIQITAYAVGQGDYTSIICPNGDLVIIDMGSTRGTSFKGQQINDLLKDYFSHNPTSKMRIIVTHPDRDHYNLFQAGLNNLNSKVDYFILSGKYSDYKAFKTWLENSFSANQINVINQGYKCYGNSECKVSPPGKNSPVINPQTLCNNDPLVNWNILGANLGKSKNSQSAVIKLQYYNNRLSTVLFPGDFETDDAQEDLINHYAGTRDLEATIYKIAHHGASRLANNLEFLKAVQPQTAFVSQAYPTTTFAHPRCDVIETPTGLLAVGSIQTVDPNIGLHSPFACGIASKTPHVYAKWNHSIFATCREPLTCYHTQIKLYSVAYSVSYIGPVPVTKMEDEIPDRTLHGKL